MRHEIDDAESEAMKHKKEADRLEAFCASPWGPNPPSSSQANQSSDSAEINKLRRELEDMEARKEVYKDWLKQSEMYAGEEEEESQRLKQEFAETKAEASSSTTSSHKREKVREADKVSIPPWPSVAGLKSWKSRVITNIFVACGDQDQKAWGDWISEAKTDSPDMDKLAKITEHRFQSIDVKLSIALNAMLDNQCW